MDSALQQRIKQSVRVTDSGCWEWRGALDGHGYGRIKIKNLGTSAHRAAYSAFVGEIPKGMMVCHTCNNRKCANPAHLYIGTAKDNHNDSVAARTANTSGIYRRPGEDNPSAKLRREDVVAIRASDLPHQILAKQFGVSRSQIYRIVRGEKWKTA